MSHCYDCAGVGSHMYKFTGYLILQKKKHDSDSFTNAIATRIGKALVPNLVKTL